MKRFSCFGRAVLHADCTYCWNVSLFHFSFISIVWAPLTSSYCALQGTAQNRRLVCDRSNEVAKCIELIRGEAPVCQFSTRVTRRKRPPVIGFRHCIVIGSSSSIMPATVTKGAIQTRTYREPVSGSAFENTALLYFRFFWFSTSTQQTWFLVFRFFKMKSGWRKFGPPSSKKVGPLLHRVVRTIIAICEMSRFTSCRVLRL